jgi:hypothetical protein
MRPVLILLALGWLAIAAAAQDQPAETKPQGKQKAAAQQKEAKPEQPAAQEEQPAQEQAEAEKPASPPAPLEVGIGWMDWNLRGNAHKFLQYATPPQGWFLSVLRYWPLASPQGYQGLLSLKNPFGDDYRDEARLDLLYGQTRLTGWVTRNRFFDTTPAVIPGSERRFEDGSFKQFLTRDFSLSFRYNMDEETHFPDIALPIQIQKTRYSDALAVGRLGNGQVTLGFSNWRYFDRTQSLPETSVDRMLARYLWEPSSTVGLEGAFSRFNIDQTGLASSAVETLTLSGDVALGPSTDAGLQYRNDMLSLPNVQDAYVRRQQMTSGRLVHRWRNWSATLGVREREEQRVRGDQTFVDVPKWWTFEGRVNGRLTRQARLTMRGYTESLSDGPQITETTDTRPLYWKNRRFAQAKLDCGWPDVNGYLTYTFRRWENSSRGVEVTHNSWLAGGNWQVAPTLSLFGEWSHETWSGRSEIADFPTLENFEPNSRLYVVGLNWAITPRAYLSLNYSDFKTFNDNPLLLRDGNVSGHFLTFNSHYRFPSGCELGLVVAPWSYSDGVVGQMDYHTTVIMVTGSGKF